MNQKLTDLEVLAGSARPLNDQDWGSERQIEAENAFFTACEEAYPHLFHEGSEFSEWALKATSEEMIDHALTLIRNA